MNLNSRINGLFDQVHELWQENDDTILIRTGACVIDAEGNHISGGTLTRGERREDVAYGIMAIPAPLSRALWEKKAAEQQRRPSESEYEAVEHKLKPENEL